MQNNQVVYLASYKGKQGGIAGFVDWAIRSVCKGPYSHSEICIGNPYESQALCVSSRGLRGGVKGLMLQMRAEDYDLIPLVFVTPKQVLDWLAVNVNAGYDYIGVARFLFPFLRGAHTTKWFCSEAAADMMQIKSPWQFNPTTLSLVAARMNA